MTRSPVLDAIAAVLGLRGDELLRALPVGIAYAAVLVSMYILKPVRNAMFLEQAGAAHMPYVLMLVAVFGGVSAFLYARLAKPGRTQSVIGLLFPLLAASFGLFWWWSPEGSGPLATVVAYAFYVWVNLFGLVATSLVWLLAGAVFDPREARRVFGLIGAFGILGAIGGGFLTDVLAELVGARHLVLVAGGTVLLAAGLLQLPRPLPRERRRRVSTATTTGGGSVVGAFGESELLRWAVPLTGLAALVSALVDVQLSEVVVRSFSGTAAKARFFGQLFAYLNVFALLFQLLLTPRLLRWLGVGRALFALPLAMASAAGGVFVLPGLLTVLASKSADLGLRHTLHKSSSEILLLPLSPEVKERGKLLLDSVADNVGTGLGAVAALFLLSGLGVGWPVLSVVTLVAAALWIAATFGARRAYVGAFRQAVSRRNLDPTELEWELNDGAAIGALLAALESDNERQVAYALDMLVAVRQSAIADRVAPLLDRPSASLRRRALVVLHAQDDASHLEEVAGLLADPDPDVRAEALHYLCLKGAEAPEERLRRHLDGQDRELRVAALSCLSRHWRGRADRLLDGDRVRALLDLDGDERSVLRQELAPVVAGLWTTAARDWLRELAADTDPQVRRAALHAMAARDDDDLIADLVAALGDRTVRSAAVPALASFGVRALGPLRDVLQDPKAAPRRRFAAARTLGRIPHQEAVVALMDALESDTFELRGRALKSLNRLRTETLSLTFDEARIRRLLEREVAWYRDLEAVTARPALSGAQARLFEQTLEEKRAETVERAFRLLALVNPPKDVYSAYLAYRSGKKLQRASAIEFLDNLLTSPDRRLILPVLDQDRPSLRPADRRWLERILDSEDTWLTATALYAADPDDPAQRPALDKAAAGTDPLLRETARLVLSA